MTFSAWNTKGLDRAVLDKKNNKTIKNKKGKKRKIKRKKKKVVILLFLLFSSCLRVESPGEKTLRELPHPDLLLQAGWSWVSEQIVP